MVGQHFDNLWIYYKDLSNRYSSFNNPYEGVSMDVVADALRGLGMNLYTNTSVSDNLYYTLFGMNPDGSLLPPTGSEVITSYVTSSIDTLPSNQLEKELYKRLYHNLPYLLKSKGTQRGIKALISCYGIPEEILTVTEFGANNIYTGSGLIEANNEKINIVTSSIALGEPVLSPYTTAQEYNNLVRANSMDIEVGFSPSNTINNNFESSSGYVNFNQLIGNPEDQYKSSYPSLDALSKQYFSTYTQPHSLYEYFRLIKYYNNSLFKMIKDFAPARSNVSTGIIIKSHILERNKYARHEPSMSFYNNYSQSVDMIDISGSNALGYEFSTSWSGSVMSPYGFATVSSTDGVEKYTGELSGSSIVVTTATSISDQSEISSNSSGSLVTTVNYGAVYQNVTASVRSLKFLDLDYTYNQNTPVNFGIITKSIIDAQIDNFQTYTNPNSPYAQLQDSNYATRAFTYPRFVGSSINSATYNTYTAGDQSYGSSATIDKVKQSFAYLVDIYSASIFLPGRSNAQIKYLINSNEAVLDLSKANFNIFDVQNFFKSGETCDVSLFEYDERNPYAQLLVNNPTLQIFEGGFRYLPILHNIGGSSTVTQSFSLQIPIEVRLPLGSTIPPSSLDPTLFNVFLFSVNETFVDPPENTEADYTFTARVEKSGGAVSSNTGVNFNYTITGPGVSYSSAGTLTITTGNSDATGDIVTLRIAGVPPGGYTISDFTFTVSDISILGRGAGGSTTGSFTTTLTTEVSSSQPCLYYNTSSNEIVFDSALSYYYRYGHVPLMNSTSDPSWSTSGLSRVVYPFSIGVGDRISFYNASSLGWNERWEYVVKNVYFTGSSSTSDVTGSRLVAGLGTTLDGSLINSSSLVDQVTGANFRTCRYIVWKHIPDETNVILRYDPKDQTLVENGLLYPQYIDEDLRDRSGNIIKSLKAQNLITNQ